MLHSSTLLSSSSSQKSQQISEEFLQGLCVCVCSVTPSPPNQSSILLFPLSAALTWILQHLDWNQEVKQKDCDGFNESLTFYGVGAPFVFNFKLQSQVNWCKSLKVFWSLMLTRLEAVLTFDLQNWISSSLNQIRNVQSLKTWPVWDRCDLWPEVWDLGKMWRFKISELAADCSVVAATSDKN